MTLLMRFLGSILFGACSFATPGMAQDYKMMEEMQRQCQLTLDAGLKTIRPSLKIYPELYNRPDLVIATPNADYNAFADHTQRQVVIPTMWCIETWYLVDAIAQIYASPQHAPQLERYVKYLSERQKRAMAAGPIDNLTLHSFDSFAGIQRKILPPEEEQRTRRNVAAMIGEAAIFVISHEIGHLALNHKGYKSVTVAQARQQEYAADAFAAKIAKENRISLIPGMMVLLRFFDSQAIASPTRTHPRGECRFERVLAATSEISDLLKDPKARRDYQKVSNVPPEEIDALMQELRAECLAKP